MLTAIQEQWLQALESGQYPQGVGKLFYEEAYCCLGVFCALQPDIVKLDAGFKYGGEVITHCLENGLWRRLGLRDNNGSFSVPLVIGGYDYRSLIGLNDSESFSFRQIAEIVRANTDKVFKNGSVPIVSTNNTRDTCSTAGSP